MDPAYRDSFEQWSREDTPAPVEPRPACNYTLGPKGPLR